jgi:RTX calcium-binding nonapeptide repeat (4 copies)
MLNSQYLATVQAQLALFAAQANFESVFATAFGDSFDPLLLQVLRQQWLTGDFSVIPDIEVLTGGELGLASGAYASELDRIFISSDFLTTANDSSIAAVLLEEIGHRIDRLFNGTVDSAGDEGEIFSLLVNGVNLSPEALNALKTQNDHAVITINSTVPIEVEEAIINGTIFGETIQGSNFADTINGGGGRDLIYGNGGDDLIVGGNNADTMDKVEMI